MDEELLEESLGNDERPNSGLREGDISHAEVNAALRAHEKTIVFGQQNRLRAGVLMEDEKLPRFHAGHDLVRFFYGAVRQLPEYLLDGLLHWGVSVTMVKSSDLLVFNHVREHQSFHTGRTRKTIYMPELALKEASEKGYDYWAISEVIISEAFPLLDYLLIVEFVRRAQQRLHEHYTLGRGFTRDTLLALNSHLKYSDREPDNEFNEFVDHYEKHFYTLNREMIDADPYEWTDGIFDEGVERRWADNKLYVIREVFQYPTYYNLDRDIVHPAAFGIAEKRGLPLKPETVEEILHDMQDAVRFEVGVQTKTDRLLDMLIDKGEPGVRGFLTLGWSEGEYFGTGYSPAVEFRQKLRAHSTSPPEGQPGSISLDFTRLLHPAGGQDLHQWYLGFDDLPFRRKRFLVLKLAELASTADMHQFVFEVDNATLYTDQDERLLKGLADILYEHYLKLDRERADIHSYLMGQLLKKLDKHALYRSVFVPQYEKLKGGEGLVLGEDIRPQIEELAALIPDKPLRLSYDPQRLRTRLFRFEQVRRDAPNSKEQLGLLAGIFLRLDRSENYGALVAKAKALGEHCWPVCAELVEQIGEKDRARQDILQAARQILSQRGDAVESGVEDREWEWPSLVDSFYKVLDIGYSDANDQALWWYMKQAQRERRHVLEGLARRGAEIPPAHRAIISLLFKSAS